MAASRWAWGVAVLLVAGCDDGGGGHGRVADAAPVADARTADATRPADAARDAAPPDAAPPIVVAADRPILDYAGRSAMDANAALTPPDYAGPMETACAADPSRQYIGELFDHDLEDVQVLWHWAPLVPGPNDLRPTLDQPEWSLAGSLSDADDSTDDVRADHPFGYDFNFDVRLDAPFAFLGYGGDEGPTGEIHCEVELGQIPRDAFGYAPAAGDRTLLRGVWVLDCGHPPYGSEMHPPTFMAWARPADARTTTALAYVAPYRSSLLFNPSTALATDFANDDRFADGQTAPFPQAFMEAVLRAVARHEEHLTAHALMVANHFDPIDFLVCAPLPRPPGAVLDASWRFTARTGVTVRASADDASGCVRVRAAMNADYAPMALPFHETDWAWNELNDSASGQFGAPIDVRQQIIRLLQGLGLNTDVPALKPENPPRIDAYEPLHPAPGADRDAPTAVVEHADDQPFPFYGRVRAAWR
jgi:hypothetical protein